ncbi:MAG TPA: hypothetical protein VMA34_16340 [Terracidiphilus sp.]|nr:hypothetical protein [Terracidiphilus sp.]
MHDLALLAQMQAQPDPEMIRRMAMAFMAIIPIFILFGIAIVMVPCWFICKKAGFSPWLSLCCLLPTLGLLVLLYVLAFADWKVAPLPPQAYWPPQPPPPPPVPPAPLPPQVAPPA